MEKLKIKTENTLKLKIGILIFLEIVFFSLFFSSFVNTAKAFVNTTVQVQSILTVGLVWPEILNVSIDSGVAAVTLVGNSTKIVNCLAVVRDYGGEANIREVYGQIFMNGTSNWSGTDDNNYHYTNHSCNVTMAYGTYLGYGDDAYTVLANCSFNVQYYANAGQWNCSIWVNNTNEWWDFNSKSFTMNELLSIGMPDKIDYGTVNATYVSNENVTNVTNTGNVQINISLSGYATYIGDNLSMNCTLGNNKNISIYYEKYNLTSSTPGISGEVNLTMIAMNYTNLTGIPVAKAFDLRSRVNDTGDNEATKATYWRIYVPRGAAGTCSGNVVFAAIRQAGSY
jgi:hypothetical protein